MDGTCRFQTREQHTLTSKHIRSVRIRPGCVRRSVTEFSSNGYGLFPGMASTLIR